MNKKVARELRKICPPIDAVSRRVYRRLKDQYKKLPRHARKDFLTIARETLQVEPKQSRGVLDEEKG
tara:strand:+ start:6861 stop:7061 length:201 start_codon:yes stop_codon:yes gene_type:complete